MWHSIRLEAGAILEYVPNHWPRIHAKWGTMVSDDNELNVFYFPSKLADILLQLIIVYPYASSLLEY